jgi:hypothetical protein
MEATKTTSCALSGVQFHSNPQQAKPTVSIGSEVQCRFVSACLETPQSTKVLLSVCAVTNVGDVAARLRKRGWLIDVARVDAENRYGENCDAYFWHILTPVETAKRALKSWRETHPLSEA